MALTPLLTALEASHSALLHSCVCVSVHACVCYGPLNRAVECSDWLVIVPAVKCKKCIKRPCRSETLNGCLSSTPSAGTAVKGERECVCVCVIHPILSLSHHLPLSVSPIRMIEYLLSFNVAVPKTLGNRGARTSAHTHMHMPTHACTHTCTQAALPI